MPPLMRWWFNLHRHNTKPLKDRQIHRIERALIIWPLHAYMWAKRRRTPQQSTQPPTGGFLMHENKKEDA